MGKHSMPDPHDSEEQFKDDVAAIAAIDSMTDGNPEAGDEALAAYLQDTEMGHWLLNYLQVTHPAVLRQALRDRDAELMRRRTVKQVQQLLDNGSGTWAAYANAIRESEDRS